MNIAGREKIGPGKAWARVLLALRRDIAVTNYPGNGGEFLRDLAAQRHQGLDLLRRVIVIDTPFELNADRKVIAVCAALKT